MNMKKILLALGIGAGVGAACYFAKKKLDEMYYDMCAAPPYVPSPAGPAKRPAATAEKKPTPDAPAAEPVAEEEGAEPSAADGENLTCKDLPRCPQRFALPFMPSGTLTDPT